ncbi:alpha-ketoglutarate-dependent dioxygenase AlkB family protein [Glycomyces niveus]|uniref:Alpha-ketoglutarate-dependent dioxygenase AlkB n=1 Tax=Glycomyces niveus TaxID=2820287 RepID=A0ABS3U1H8_9ACTN|nr:alpha-ketoglutarate-dependent dioxygenase AlkB [Glycomyces sp. NEAU-S30]MBO3732623.1 alpha-ketoglutarate-dependent dioxygenase AlkB [Glycomyces sp. NEAU-S30]
MDGELFPRDRTEVAPGAVLLPDWLDEQRQRELVAACREWARPPAGMRTVRTPGGGVMSAKVVCLGWHWRPYHFSKTADDGSPVKPFPPELRELARRAIDAYGGAPGDGLEYDMALLNFYDAKAHMGMHQDKEELSKAPVISLSLGDTCVFRFGNTESRSRPYTDLELRSGDLFVFGGPSRLAFHGVPRILSGTAPSSLGLTGRLNLTLRATGLNPSPETGPQGRRARGEERAISRCGSEKGSPNSNAG